MALLSHDDELVFDSSMRASFRGQSHAPAERGPTDRYGNTQQPWAMATLGHREKGIVPERYSSKVKQHLQHIRTRTAPASFDLRESKHALSLEDDVMSVTNDAAAAEEICSWASSASRLERTVLQQMFRDVAAKVSHCPPAQSVRPSGTSSRCSLAMAR